MGNFTCTTKSKLHVTDARVRRILVNQGIDVVSLTQCKFGRTKPVSVDLSVAVLREIAYPCPCSLTSTQLV